VLFLSSSHAIRSNGARVFWYFPSVALILAIAAMVTACSSQAEQSAPQGAAAGGRGRGDAAVPVTTAVAMEKSMPVTVTAVGNVEAMTTMPVRSQVSGRVAQVHFSEGQDVTAGQLLFTIDPQPFQVALDQAEAVLARDTAQANNAQAQVERYENLFKRGLIARDQYETQVATGNALKATTQADQAAIAAAKLNLEYTKIVAPGAGRTGALLVHQGDLVQANNTASLVVINQMAPIYVTFALPGKLLAEVRKFQRSSPLKITVEIPGDEDAFAETGTLTFIDNAVDPQTGTIKLKGTFANTAHHLWPGQAANVSVQLHGDPHALVVPSTAVQAGPQGTYVWAVADGHAQMKSIAVARVEGDQSVLESGISAGEVVVTDGALRLTPNARIADRGATSGRAGRAGGGGAQ
jgi:multidrug efflux system membrane fusion protein